MPLETVLGLLASVGNNQQDVIARRPQRGPAAPPCPAQRPGGAMSQASRMTQVSGTRRCGGKG
jgi:hypothetical protein